MGASMRGKVVVLPFPFSDLSTTKRRPALIIADLTGDDIICCQITSQQARQDKYTIALMRSDFVSGSLQKDSYVRPNRLFTADAKIILYEVGALKNSKFDEVTAMLIDIVTGNI